MSAHDYYHEARSIAADLKRIGRAEDGCKILDAIDTGSTATEILMALRYHFANVILDQSLPADVKNPVMALLADLRAILR